MLGSQRGLKEMWGQPGTDQVCPLSQSIVALPYLKVFIEYFSVIQLTLAGGGAGIGGWALDLLTLAALHTTTHYQGQN